MNIIKNIKHKKGHVGLQLPTSRNPEMSSLSSALILHKLSSLFHLRKLSRPLSETISKFVFSTSLAISPNLFFECHFPCWFSSFYSLISFPDSKLKTYSPHKDDKIDHILNVTFNFAVGSSINNIKFKYPEIGLKNGF